MNHLMLFPMNRNMLLPNNTKIDTEQLANKMEALKSRANLATNATENTPENVTQGQEVIGVADKPSSVLTHVDSKASAEIGPTQRRLSMFAPGLSLRQRIGLIPLIGGVVIWATSILKLTSIRQKIAIELEVMGDNARCFQEQTLESLRTQAEQIARIEAHVQAMQAQLNASEVRFAQLENTSAATNYRISSHWQQFNLTKSEQDNRLANLVREIRQLQSQNVVVSSTASSAERALLLQATRQPEPEIEVPGLDGFYVEFEDNFRGTSTDIKARLEVYLPYLQQFSGDQSATVIDIGCGRGEWLGLLKQNQINAIGIDMNTAMVETCRDRGFSAYCLDAIDYLREQPEASLAAITGFHIIEHLPFKVLLSLFDAALRALRPDGLIIFETPNPENLAVGACNFYFDPTHLNPIVPAVAQFMAKQRGFAKAEILRLHPYPDDFKLVEDSELAKRFNHALYGPQDFSVIAWKLNAN
jgi:SAM-dependent methyltransferase